MAFTKVVGAGIHTLSNITSHNINSSGIITATKFVGPMENSSGISTFYDVRVTNNLTVDGTTTTLDTKLVEVDKIEVEADSTNVAIAVTHTGSGDILRLYDSASQVVTVDDEGQVGIGTATPAQKLDVVGNMKISGNIDANGDLDVDGLTNLDNTIVAGIATFTNVVTKFAAGNGGNTHLQVLSTGTGEAGIFFDAANGDISGSDYCFIGQQNNLDLVIKANPNAGNIDFQRGTDTKVRIDTNGNLNVNYDLDVTGNAGIGSLSVTGVSTFTDNITFGVTASSTAITSGTIKQVSLGKDYWNGDKGHYGALRLLVYDNGVNDAYGLGISNGELEIQSQGHIGIYAGSGASDSKRDRRMYIGMDGDVIFGYNTSGSTNSSDLFNMSLGGTYHDTNGAMPKLSLWHDGTDHMGFGVSPNQLDYILTSTSYDHVFYGGNAGTTELLRIKGGTGKVGIGTDNPDHSLHVYKEGGDSVISIESSGNGNHSALEFIRTSSGGNSKGAGSIYVTGNTSASEAIMKFAVGHNVDHEHTPSMVIMGNGEVGIGTDNPTQPLTIARSSAGQGEFGLRFQYTNTTGPTQTSSALLVGSYGLKLKNYNSSRNFLFETGDVGIGTDTPSAPLNVHKINGTIAVFGDDRSGDNSTFECIKIKNNVTAYPAITNDSSNDTLDLRSMGSVQVTIDSNDNSTGKYFRVVTNGEGDSGTELFKVKDDGKVVLGNSTGAQPSSTVGGAQFWGGSYPGDFRISSGAGASGTEAGAMSIMGSNHNASLAHGSNYGAQLSLFNYNTTDGNSTAVSYHNSNGLAIARVIGNNVSHSSRTGQLVFMTSNGSHPEEKMRLTKDGQLDITANNNGNPIGMTIKNTNTASHSHARLRLEAQNAASYSNIYTDHANSALRLEYNSSNSMYIKSNGRVGLGTASPGAKLHIQSGDLAIKQGTLYLSSDRDAAVPGSSYGYQVISGYKVFPGSDTYVGLAYVGHSHSIIIQYMCVENGDTSKGGSHGSIHFHTTYGNSQQGIGQQAHTNAMNGGRITSGVSFSYCNGPSCGSHGNNYVLRAKVSYTGTDNFALHYTIKGISSGNMYV